MRIMHGVAAVLVAAGLGAIAAAETPTIRILPFGDSITYGASAGQVDPSFTGGYRKPLYDSLTAAGYSVEFVGSRNGNSGGMTSVLHEGYPGYRISNWYNPAAAGIYETMWDSFARIKNPHIVLLHIGTNDIGDGAPGEPAYSIGKMRELLNRIREFEPGAEIVVSTLMIRATESSRNYITQQFNPALRTLVANCGDPHVHLLDLEDCLSLEDLSDDVHPNDDGYQKMADRWFDAITGIVSQSGWTPNDEISVLYPVTNATTTTSIVLKMNAEMNAASVADTSHYTIDGASVASAVLANDLHTITVNFAAPVATDVTHNLGVSGLANKDGTATLAAKTVPFEVSASGAAAHVPASDLDGYHRVCTYDFPEAVSLYNVEPAYANDTRENVGGMSRIGYYFELREKGGSLRWLWVSMDAFTDDPMKIGIPTRGSGALFDCYVSNLVIRSNAPGISEGERALGNIEFFPGNYGYECGSFQLPNGSASLGDFDDAPSMQNGAPAGNYGSFQIHDFQTGTTLFSWTKWGGYCMDGNSRGDGRFTNIGIGNAPSGNPDWTYTEAKCATSQPGIARGYDIRRMEIFVRSNVQPPAPRPASETTIRIMPLGDSITYGYDGSSQGNGGYRAPLYNLLTQAGYSIEFCGSQTSEGLASPRHEGHSGYRISNNYCPDQNGLLENLPNWFSDGSCKNPHIVLLHIGTNDGNGNDGPANLRAYGLANMNRLVDRIAELEPGADIVVTTLLPRDYNKNGTDHANEAIQDTFNPGLPALVADHVQRGQKVHFFDLGRYLTVDDMPDGCHPGSAGYAKMAQGWFDCITNLVPLTADYVPNDTPAVVKKSVATGVVTFTMNQTMGEAAANPALYSVNVPSVNVDSVSVVGRVVTVRLSSSSPVTQEITLTVRGLPNAEGTYASAAMNVPLYLVQQTEVTNGGLAVGRGERVEVDVAAEQTMTQSVPIVQEGQSRLVKTGEGTWKLPLTAFRQNGAINLAVRGGTVEIEKGEMLPSYAKPTAILNRASFWISAKNDAGEPSSKLVLTNGANGAQYVAKWCDERETDMLNPTMRYAYPDWSTPEWTSVLGVPPTLETKEGRVSVYFGGYTSGKFMPIMKSGNYSELTGIREVFCVHGVFNSMGYVLGNYSVPDNERHNSYVHLTTTGFNGTTKMWQANNVVSGPDRGGWTYLDGEYIPDTISQAFSAGFHLLSVKSGWESGYLGAFYTNRRYQNRQGGDYLNEVVVFDCELSVAERVQVTQYLMQKWGILPAAGAVKGRVELAEGTTLRVDDAAMSALDFAGVGTLEKTGDGAVTLSSLEAFNGSVHLAGGSLTVQKDDEAICQFSAGERLQAESGFAGLTLTPSADAGEGVVSVQGSGLVRATSVPADVTLLKVENGGILSLSAPSTPAYGTVVPGYDPVVTNGNIEMYDKIGGLGPNLANVNSWYGDVYGWLQQGMHGFFWNEDKYSFEMQKYLASDNRQYIDIQNEPGNEALVYTRVRIPRAGCYELSFDGVGRQNYDRYMNEVKVGPSLDALTTLARFKYQRIGPFERGAWRLPYLEEGSYIIGVKALTMPVGAGGTLLDNFRLDFISATPEPSVWKIPNGDFELLTNVKSAANSSSSASIENTAENWTFDNGGYTDAGDPYVGVLVHGMTAGGGSYYQPNYADPRSEKGVVQLLIVDLQGRARTTFRPPAGTWKLRADTAICSLYFRGRWEWNRSAEHLQATVTAGDAATTLGKVTVNTSAMSPTTWPTTFTVDGETYVTLELQQTDDQYGALLVDNLELVQMDGEDREYVQDGGFEVARQSNWNTGIESVCWRTSQNNVGQKYSYIYPVNYASYFPDQIGRTTYEGAQYAIVCGTASMEQDLNLDAAGVYVFSMRTGTRYNEKEGGHTNQGKNPLKVYIYPAGGNFDTDAQEIGSYEVKSLEFVKRTAYFRIPAAGRYTLRIQGQTRTANSDNIARVDGVSVKRASVAAEAPSVPEKLQVSVASGAKLRLDYPGTIQIDHLRLGGRSVTGTVTAAKYPDYILGPGTIEILPKSTFLIFR